MWVIAAMVQERAGMDFRDFVRARIADPLGLPDLRVGCPRAEQGRLADIEYRGRAWTDEELAAKGFPPLPVTEVTEENLMRFNDAPVRELGVPGGGGTATAGDLALFYQSLLQDGIAHDGTRIWERAVLCDARKIRNPSFLDPLFRKPANRGLGIVVAGGTDKFVLGFGRTGSDDMFGHGGAGGQIAWADPGSGLSFSYLTSGHDRDHLRQGRRIVALSSLAAVCAL
jgi:CubicO group peptidase (beta-lactamase class C family)